MDPFEIISETKFDFCQQCMKNNEIAKKTFLYYIKVLLTEGQSQSFKTCILK